MLVQTISAQGRIFLFDHSQICEINPKLNTELDTTIVLSNGSVALSNRDVAYVVDIIKMGIENQNGLAFIE
jgi:hypothetical protein